MGFQNFPSHKLEELIGQETLVKVHALLPAIDANTEADDLYRKKTLIKILYAFIDANRFAQSALRRDFLAVETEPTINAFCRQAGINIPASFDEKVDAIVKKGWKDQEFCRSFCEFFGLPDQFIPQPSAEVPNLEWLGPSETPYKVLKDYQTTIAFKAVKELENRNARFVIQMPTGSGKTRTAIEIIADAFNRQARGCVIFWLVYSEELCDQAVEAFQEIWRHVGNKKVKLVRAWGKNRLVSQEGEESVFVVGGFQKLHAQLANDPSLFASVKDSTYLIVVDEAHRVLAPTYREVTDALFGVNARLIGLTATPGRGINNIDETEALADYFDREKITVTVPEGQTVFSYFRQRGVLSHARFDPLRTSPTFQLTASQQQYLEKHWDFPPGFLKTLSADETRNYEIIRDLRRRLQTHEKALFFGCSVEHSRFVSSVLNYLGTNAAHVDGKTERGARNAILNNFKTGDLQIICNYGILSTGFDAPKTDLVFIARPTQSIVLYSQMIGRGLRGPQVGGTPSCTIVTVRDNIQGLPNEAGIFTYFDDYFEQ